jgi:hypothetical protein
MAISLVLAEESLFALWKVSIYAHIMSDTGLCRLTKTMRIMAYVVTVFCQPFHSQNPCHTLHDVLKVVPQREM